MRVKDQATGTGCISQRTKKLREPSRKGRSYCIHRRKAYCTAEKIIEVYEGVNLKWERKRSFNADGRRYASGKRCDLHGKPRK